jgi:hypothetical protein
MKMYIFIKKPSDNTKDVTAAYNRSGKKIIEELLKMKPYLTVSHGLGTNVVYVDNRWKGPQIIGNLEYIRNMKNVVNYIFSPEPLEELDDTVYDHDFFKAYSLGCTLLESYATRILKKYFDKNDVHVKNDTMNRTSLSMLYTHKIIDHELYDYMIKINKLRSFALIHEDMTDGIDVEKLAELSEYIDIVQMCVKKLHLIHSSL